MPYVSFTSFGTWAELQDLYTDEETSLSTAYPAEIKNTVNEKLNIRRRIRYRRNRVKGTGNLDGGGDLESATSTNSGDIDSPNNESGMARTNTQAEEEEEELPQMSILATVVRLFTPRAMGVCFADA
jgi:hypothetical protein